MEAVFQTARESVGDEDDEEAIDLFDHCALCLRPFSDNYNDTGWSVGEVQSGCFQVQNPKLSTFHHIWEYLGVKITEGEEEWKFINGKSVSNESTSGIPPTCMTCYCYVLILNDFHSQMMKIKMRLQAQARRLRDVILEAGTGSGGAGYTGRLKQFCEFVTTSGGTFGGGPMSLSKTMDFLCKIRNVSLDQDPLPQFRPRQSEPRMEDWHWPAFSDDEDEEDFDVKSCLSAVSDQDINDKNGESEMLMDDSKGNENEHSDDELMDLDNELTGRTSRSSSESDDCKDDDDDYSPVKDSSTSSSESEESVSNSDKESKRKRQRKQVLIPRSSKSGMMMVIIPPLDSEKERSQQCEICNEQIKVTPISMAAHLETHNFKADEVYAQYTAHNIASLRTNAQEISRGR